MDVKEEEILGPEIAAHWYYVAKGRALRAFLGDLSADRLLDVGAGSGVFSRQLLDSGICRRATCVDPAYREERTETHGGKPIRFVRSAAADDYDLVLMMDVLEHVDDDVALLRQHAGLLAPDGRVLITVPAFRFLWSGHDVFLEHRRRYARPQLEEVVRRAGLEVVRSRYFFGLLFPVAAAMRLADAWRLRRGTIEAKSALRRHPRWLNTALITVHELERPLLFPVNVFAGLTVFCLARPRRHAG